MSARPPGAYGSSSNGSSPSSAQATILDEEDLLSPPWFEFLKSGIGILAGLIANGWQWFTTFIAFQILIAAGSPGGVISRASLSFVIMVCALIATAIQLAVILFVFKVGKRMKNTTVTKSGTNLMNKLKHTAVGLDNRDFLFLVWVGIAFIGDTIGDMTFVRTYTDSGFVIFFYAAALYALSTVLLAKSLEGMWASQVAFIQWKAMMNKALHTKGGRP